MRFIMLLIISAPISESLKAHCARFTTFTSETRRQIDTDLAREALKDIIAPDEARPITPEVIIETVTEHYNYKVTKDDILGKNRSRDISYPRQICMYLCEKYTGLSLAAIGAALGNKIIQRFFMASKKLRLTWRRMSSYAVQLILSPRS